MKPPYSYNDWLDKRWPDDKDIPDIAPEILYDGYVFELEKLGYTIYGNCYDGITVEKEVR